MKIYTKTGDRGETGLFGGARVSKDAPRVEAYGAVDELNASIGVAIATLGPGELARQLERVQSDLFSLGADLATPDGVKSAAAVRIDASAIGLLEGEIDAWEVGLTPLASFILPGGTPAAAQLHYARTVCRRAERRVIALAHRESISDTPIRFLNRLSDWLFVAARQANASAGVADRPWLSQRMTERTLPPPD